MEQADSEHRLEPGPQKIATDASFLPTSWRALYADALTSMSPAVLVLHLRADVA